MHRRLHAQRPADHLRHRSRRRAAFQQHFQQAGHKPSASERGTHHCFPVHRHQRRRDRVNSRVHRHHSGCNNRHQSQLPHSNHRQAHSRPTRFCAREMESRQTQCAHRSRRSLLHLLLGRHPHVTAAISCDLGKPFTHQFVAWIQCLLLQSANSQLRTCHDWRYYQHCSRSMVLPFRHRRSTLV